jgi:hypothetical protein
MLHRMEKRDFRGLGYDVQEALPARAVYLVLTLGKAEAAEAVDSLRQAVNRWLKRHAKAGDAALLDGRRVSPRKGRRTCPGQSARKNWSKARRPRCVRHSAARTE